MKRAACRRKKAVSSTDNSPTGRNVLISCSYRRNGNNPSQAAAVDQLHRVYDTLPLMSKTLKKWCMEVSWKGNINKGGVYDETIGNLLEWDYGHYTKRVMLFDTRSTRAD